MHRYNIARISGDKVILDGTTIDEVEKYHRDTLKLSVNKANQIEKEILEKQRLAEQRESERKIKHNETVQDIAKRINFD